MSGRGVLEVPVAAGRRTALASDSETGRWRWGVAVEIAVVACVAVVIALMVAAGGIALASMAPQASLETEAAPVDPLLICTYEEVGLTCRHEPT